MGFKYDVRNALERIERKLNLMAVDLTAITNTVNNLVSIANSAVTEMQGLSADIAKLQAGNNDAATQAAVDALQVRTQAALDALTAGIANNPVPTV